VESELKQFIQLTRKKSKKGTPNVGEFFCLLSVSDSTEFEDLAIPLLREMHTRSVGWTLKNPKLMSTRLKEIVHRRVSSSVSAATGMYTVEDLPKADGEQLSEAFFRGCVVGRRLLQFHHWFLQNVARPKHRHSKSESSSCPTQTCSCCTKASWQDFYLSIGVNMRRLLTAEVVRRLPGAAGGGSQGLKGKKGPGGKGSLVTGAPTVTSISISTPAFRPQPVTMTTVSLRKGPLSLSTTSCATTAVCATTSAPATTPIPPLPYAPIADSSLALAYDCTFPALPQPTKPCSKVLLTRFDDNNILCEINVNGVSTSVDINKVEATGTTNTIKNVEQPREDTPSGTSTVTAVPRDEQGALDATVVYWLRRTREAVLSEYYFIPEFPKFGGGGKSASASNFKGRGGSKGTSSGKRGGAEEDGAANSGGTADSFKETAGGNRGG